MSNVVSINSMKQVPAAVSNTVESLDESDQAYMGGLDEGFIDGYAAGYRAATAAAGKIAEKAIHARPRTEGSLAESLCRMIGNWNSVRYSRKRKFAGSTAAKREYLAFMKEYLGY